MHTNRLILAATALVAGPVSAHQGPHLIAHLHPHLGLEHLVLGAAAVALSWVLIARRRRG